MSETTRNRLATRCPCGHEAIYHQTPEAQAMQLVNSGGRYSGECKGGVGRHCRCITDREQVITAGTPS